MVLVAALVGWASWLIYTSCQSQIAQSNLLNKDLLDRLFQSKGLPPTGVNVAETYIEKKQAEKQRRDAEGPNRKITTLEKVRERFKIRDRADVASGVDVTSKGTN